MVGIKSSRYATSIAETEGYTVVLESFSSIELFSTYQGLFKVGSFMLLLDMGLARYSTVPLVL